MAAENLIDELLEDARERMGKSVRVRPARVLDRAHRAREPVAARPRDRSTTTARMTPLNQLATISAPEARLITVQPYDKSSIKAIEKAINESDVGPEPVQRRQRRAPGRCPS